MQYKREAAFVWPGGGLYRAHSLNKRKTLWIIISAWLAPEGLVKEDVALLQYFFSMS